MSQDGRKELGMGGQQAQCGLRIVIGASHAIKSQFLASQDVQRQAYVVIRWNSGHNHAPGMTRALDALINAVSLAGTIDGDVDAPVSCVAQDLARGLGSHWVDSNVGAQNSRQIATVSDRFD